MDKDYYCLPHYNNENKTSYTYDEVLVEAKRCKCCGIRTLCVVGFGREDNPLVEKCKDDIQFYYELVEKSKHRRRLRVKKRQRLFGASCEQFVGKTAQ